MRKQWHNNALFNIQTLPSAAAFLTVLLYRGTRSLTTSCNILSASSMCTNGSLRYNHTYHNLWKKHHHIQRTISLNVEVLAALEKGISRPHPESNVWMFARLNYLSESCLICGMPMYLWKCSSTLTTPCRRLATSPYCLFLVMALQHRKHKSCSFTKSLTAFIAHVTVPHHCVHSIFHFY